MERDLAGSRSRQRVLQKLVLLVVLGVCLYFMHTNHQEQMKELDTTKSLLLMHINDLQNKVAKLSVGGSAVAPVVTTAPQCLNGGRLVDGACKCLPGFTGVNCDKWSSPDGGAWSADLHIRDRFHDPKIIETALRLIKDPVTSVMDVGCGLGLYLNDFYKLGAKRCVGVEPSPMNKDPESPFHTGICQQLEIDAFDLNQAEIDLKETFDVVMSVEVVEHIHREKHTRFFNFITKHARHSIIFSGAYKGQGGHGHISERPWDEWVQEFNSRGWEFDEKASLELRKVSIYVWFRSNLAIFRRKK